MLALVEANGVDSNERLQLPSKNTLKYLNTNDSCIGVTINGEATIKLKRTLSFWCNGFTVLIALQRVDRR